MSTRVMTLARLARPAPISHSVAENLIMARELGSEPGTLPPTEWGEMDMDWIQSLDEYVSTVQRETPVVMVFSADWCADCRYLDFFIDDVAAQYAGKLDMFKVNRDEFGDLCETLEIMGIPSFLVYRNGEVVNRWVNGKRKTREEVEDFLNTVLQKPH